MHRWEGCLAKEFFNMPALRLSHRCQIDSDSAFSFASGVCALSAQSHARCSGRSPPPHEGRCISGTSCSRLTCVSLASCASESRSASPGSSRARGSSAGGVGGPCLARSSDSFLCVSFRACDWDVEAPRRGSERLRRMSCGQGDVVSGACGEVGPPIRSMSPQKAALCRAGRCLHATSLRCQATRRRSGHVRGERHRLRLRWGGGKEKTKKKNKKERGRTRTRIIIYRKEAWLPTLASLNSVTKF